MKTGSAIDRGAARLGLSALLAVCLAGCSLLPKKHEAGEAPQPTPAQAAASPQPPAPHRPKTSLLQKLFSWLPWFRPKPPKALPLGSSGTIYMVNEPGGFVVLESSASSALEAGAVLSTIQEGRITATLRVAPEKRPPFVIAEILSGKPTVGEKLYVVP